MWVGWGWNKTGVLHAGVSIHCTLTRRGVGRTRAYTLRAIKEPLLWLTLSVAPKPGTLNIEQGLHSSTNANHLWTII